ncbi:MAG: glycerophosphodiester phosphodiesterase family protein [Ferruginibacter sp.]
MIKYLFTIGLTLSIILLSCKTPKTTQAIILPGFDKQGHRGCRGLMPENTIPAMLKAIDLGVTTLEMDVVFTKDKVAILSHEPYYNADITTTPAGKPLEEKDGKNLNIYQMNFEETRRYDVGLKNHPRFSRQQKIKSTKPSLASLIDSVELYLDVHDFPKVDYNIETKTSPATDNIYHPAPEEFVEELMKVIKNKAIEGRVIIQSFDFRTLQVLHKNYPAVRTAMLIEEYDKRTLDEQLTALGFEPTIYSPAHLLVNKALIDACHQKKIRIIPWTVNDKPTIDNLRQSGVDGIITDYPDLFGK